MYVSEFEIAPYIIELLFFTSTESPKPSPISPLTSPGAKNLIQIGTTPPKTAPETILSSTHLCTPTVETSFDDGLPFSNNPQDPLPPKRTPPHVSIISATTFELIMKLGEDEMFLLDIQPTTKPVSLRAMKNQLAPTGSNNSPPWRTASEGRVGNVQGGGTRGVPGFLQYFFEN